MKAPIYSVFFSIGPEVCIFISSLLSDIYSDEWRIKFKSDIIEYLKYGLYRMELIQYITFERALR